LHVILCFNTSFFYQAHKPALLRNGSVTEETVLTRENFTQTAM